MRQLIIIIFLTFRFPLLSSTFLKFLMKSDRKQMSGVFVSVTACVKMLKGISRNYCSVIVTSFKEGLLYSYLLNCVPTELVKALAKTIFFLYLSPPPQTCFCYVLAC